MDDVNQSSQDISNLKFRGKVNGEWWYVDTESEEWQQFWDQVESGTVQKWSGKVDEDRNLMFEDVKRRNCYGGLMESGQVVSPPEWSLQDCTYQEGDSL
jgi:hypothetical protein